MGDIRVAIGQNLRTGWLPAYVLYVEGGLRGVMQCDAHAENSAQDRGDGSWETETGMETGTGMGTRKARPLGDPRKDAGRLTY